MLKIGDFSKLAMVTVKALRFYDEEGLLKPVKVDCFTGYRYYSNRQLYDANRIVSLRQAGLSVSDIKAIASGSNTAEILEKRKTELEREKNESVERYNRIAKIIDSLKEGETMKFQAAIKNIPDYKVFTGVAKLHDFGELGGFICELGEECKKSNPGVKCLNPDYCFITYLDEEFTPNDFTVMYAQAVENVGKDSGKIKFAELPGITAVSVAVKGGYAENLPKAYAFVTEWIEDNGYVINGKVREVYIDGVWNKQSEDEYLTEIQMPVKKV